MAQYQLVPSPASQAPRTQGRPQQRQPTAADMAANIAIDMWSRILGLIADGVLPHKAIETVGATRALVEGMLRGRPEFRKQWEEAKIAAERRHWDADMLSEICNQIAAGVSVQKACEIVGRPKEMFVKLVLADPLLREEYDMARRIRAELWADENIDIADDDGNDFDLSGKGNTAAVNRSKLRVETRQKLMSVYNRDRFGDKQQKPQDVNVTVNLNAAERLESARARRLQVMAKDVTNEDAVDAEVVSESPKAVQAIPPKALSAETTSSSAAGAARKRVLGQTRNPAGATVAGNSASAPSKEGAVSAAADRSWLEG